MSVRSEPLSSGSHIAWNRVASAISWLIGVLFTYLLLAAAAPKLGWLVALIIAAAAQLLLTIAERPLFRLKEMNGIGSVIVRSIGSDQFEIVADPDVDNQGIVEAGFVILQRELQHANMLVKNAPLLPQRPAPNDYSGGVRYWYDMKLNAIKSPGRKLLK